MSCGNMGANDSGPMPWLNDTTVAHVKVDAFQKVFQFCSLEINARSPHGLRHNLWSHLQAGHEGRPMAAAPVRGPTWRRT